jgi:hypothetical protein
VAVDAAIGDDDIAVGQQQVDGDAKFSSMSQIVAEDLQRPASRGATRRKTRASGSAGSTAKRTCPR